MHLSLACAGGSLKRTYTNLGYKRTASTKPFFSNVTPTGSITKAIPSTFQTVKKKFSIEEISQQSMYNNTIFDFLQLHYFFMIPLKICAIFKRRKCHRQQLARPSNSLRKYLLRD